MSNKHKLVAIVSIVVATLLCACGSQSDAVPAQQNRQAALVQHSAADSATFLGNRANYTITRTATGYDVTDTVGTGGATAVSATAVLEFIDTKLALDTDGTAGQAYRIYQAAFNRQPDLAGLAYWIEAMNNGASLTGIAAGFIASTEFQELYGAQPGNRAMVIQFYQNVLHRAPDAAGLDYWVSILDTQAGSPAEVLAGFSESPENKRLVMPAIAGGIAYPATQASPAIAALRSPSDTFSASALDSCRWFDWSNSAPPVSQNHGLRLETDAQQAVSLPRVQSQYSVRGDFSMEVSVMVDAGFNAAIPNDAQKYASFGLYADQDHYLQIGLAREGGQTVIKPLLNNGGQFQNPPTFPVATSQVKLRLSSSANIVTLAYDSGAGWQAAGSMPRLLDGEYYVSLNAATIGVRQQFAATFSNFIFQHGTSTYRPYVRGPLTSRPGFAAGGVTEGYAYDALLGVSNWGTVNPFQVMAANGMGWTRTTVTTQSVEALKNTPVSGWAALPWNTANWQSQEVTSEVLALSTAQGLKNSLVFYLSDTAANASVQNAPAAWAGLSLADTAAKVKQHTQAVTQLYQSQGRQIALYEIGNEIDTGILNFRPGERIALPPGVNPTTDMAYMRSQVWPAEATLLKAAIEGVRSVVPNARIVVHAAYIGVTPSDHFVKAFFKAMVDNGVPFDVAGLSIPYSQLPWRLNEYTTDCWFQRLQETSDYLARLGKTTMISEASYAQSSTGNVAAPMRDFPFTDQGQAAWVREYLRFGNNNPNVEGFMYFYPDWYPGRARGDGSTMVLETYGLFNADKSARPALQAFKLPPR
nr:glycosyl hydrolase 53 family protein [uncultured Duganella sp.]